MRAAIPRLRSLRFRAFVVVVVVLVSPVALVAISAWQDRGVGDAMGGNVGGAVVEATQALVDAAKASSGPKDADIGARCAAEIDTIARARGVRLRVVGDGGHILVDADHERGVPLLRRFGDFMFGDDGAPTLRDLDARDVPLAERPESQHARTTHRPTLDCTSVAADRLLVCNGAQITSIRMAQNPLDAAQPILVHAQESSRRPARALYDLRYELLRLTLVLLPVALFLAWWLGWRAVRPIEQLRKQVLAKTLHATSSGDLDLARRDEIGDLATSFNELLRALDERRAENESFVADLVHELKNPLAAIRACADSIESSPLDAPRRERLSRVLRDSTRRLDALATAFLDLARTEAGMPNEIREPVDVCTLVRGLVDAVASDERHRDKSISVNTPGSLVLSGVSIRLEAVVRNLLENALSFAKFSVEITVRRVDEVAIVTVTDDGVGLTPEVAPHVFDRFFTTRDRSRDSTSTGTGLGLALVRATVEAHGGSVTAGNAPSGGATFEIRLPAS